MDILKSFSAEKVFNALKENLTPIYTQNFSAEFLAGKVENFLTCRAVCAYLREKSFLNETDANMLEELSLIATRQVFFTKVEIADLRLLIAELPKILPLKYSIVENLRQMCLDGIPQMINAYRYSDYNAWKKFVNLKYLSELLKII